MTVGEWKAKTKRKYPFSNELRFIASKKIDNRRKLKGIVVYYLCHSEIMGYRVFEIKFHKGKALSLTAWAAWIEDKTDTGGWYVFTQKILDAHNIRTGHDFILKDVLAWRCADAVSKHKNTSTNKRDNAKPQRRK